MSSYLLGHFVYALATLSVPEVGGRGNLAVDEDVSVEVRNSRVTHVVRSHRELALLF